MRNLGWSLFALLGGVLWSTCFTADPLIVVPWIGLAPLVLLLGLRGSLRWVFLWGVAFWIFSLHWIVPTMVTFGGLSAVATWPLFVMLASLLALFAVAFAALGRRVWASRHAWLAMTGLAAIWTTLEWTRSWFLGGFPWNTIAYAWVDVPGALEASAWIGGYGVSFLVVWANVGVARAITDRDWRPLAWGLLIPMTLLGTAWRWTEVALADTRATGEPFEARVLQPDIPNQEEWDPATNLSDYKRLVQQSIEACDVQGAFIVWPESAAWPRRLGRDQELDRDLQMLNDLGCSILLSNPRYVGDAIYNSAFLLRRDGQRSYYDKRFLVPFGEYVPAGRFLPFAETLARNVGDFTPGSGVQLLDVAGCRLGVAICYEVVFPSATVSAVESGATALVSITNDDWYGPTSAAWQHLRAAQFRAAENRRTLLRAAVTGVSAVIGPNGAVVQRAVPGEFATLRTRVVPRSDRTLYSYVAGQVPMSSLLLAAFAIFLARRTSTTEQAP